MAGGVKPAVRAEEHGIVEVLGVVGDSPAACVELGLYGGRKVLSQKHIPKRGPHLIIGTKISRKRSFLWDRKGDSGKWEKFIPL